MTKKSEYRTEWSECRLSEVMSYFAKDFKPVDGSEIMSVDWFVDTTRNVVIFKLLARREVDAE